MQFWQLELGELSFILYSPKTIELKFIKQSNDLEGCHQGGRLKQYFYGLGTVKLYQEILPAMEISFQVIANHIGICARRYYKKPCFFIYWYEDHVWKHAM